MTTARFIIFTCFLVTQIKSEAYFLQWSWSMYLYALCTTVNPRTKYPGFSRIHWKVGLRYACLEGMTSNKACKWQKCPISLCQIIVQWIEEPPYINIGNIGMKNILTPRIMTGHKGITVLWGTYYWLLGYVFYRGQYAGKLYRNNRQGSTGSNLQTKQQWSSASWEYEYLI